MWRGLVNSIALLIIALGLVACGAADPVPPLAPIPDLQLPPAGTFHVALSGGIDAVYTGTGSVASDPAIGRAIYLTGERFSANLVMPLDQATGTYAILPFLTAFNPAQTVIAVGGLLVDSAPAAPLVSPAFYGDVRVGRLTLLAIEPLSGAFEFTTIDDSGSEILVRATFAELSLVQAETP